MVDESVVASVREYLRALRKHDFAVSFGVIFGSQTTGEMDRSSDIDLLVVSPRFDKPRERKDVNLLWRLAARTDSRIEPIPCGERQWRDDEASPIIEIARREGEQVVT